MNNRVSNHMFKILEEHGIETHFVKEISDRETIVKRLTLFLLKLLLEILRLAAFLKGLGLVKEQGLKIQYWSTAIK